MTHAPLKVTNPHTLLIMHSWWWIQLLPNHSHCFFESCFRFCSFIVVLPKWFSQIACPNLSQFVPIWALPNQCSAPKTERFTKHFGVYANVSTKTAWQLVVRISSWNSGLSTRFKVRFQSLDSKENQSWCQQFCVYGASSFQISSWSREREHPLYDQRPDSRRQSRWVLTKMHCIPKFGDQNNAVLFCFFSNSASFFINKRKTVRVPLYKASLAGHLLKYF